ncbi:amidohydrolase [Streptomyces sp. NPDC101249]|uniref:amidohydrolase n=1 Tax=Streptomyces sp. NPDC101249 TaxID=3366140 RepID=UPI0037F77FFF
MLTDVHQYLWPPAFTDLLRARSAPPRLDGWTLHLAGEAPFPADPADHDVAARARLAAADGLDRALVSLSSPLGVEHLPPEESAPLLAAYHDGALALPPPFGVWAAAGVTEPDPDAVARELDRGCVGLQLPATALLDAPGWQRCAPLLDVLTHRGKPLFVHPGPAPAAPDAPAWWPAMVPYPQQLHASWFAFRAFGRSRHPGLRVCFAALAGLAPLHGERFAARGGGRGQVDFDVFYETSSYGTRAVDAVVRAAGIDVVVAGSDRPYARPVVPDLGADAAVHALRTANPARLLTGGPYSEGSRS